LAGFAPGPRQTAAPPQVTRQDEPPLPLDLITPLVDRMNSSRRTKILFLNHPLSTSSAASATTQWLHPERPCTCRTIDCSVTGPPARTNRSGRSCRTFQGTDLFHQGQRCPSCIAWLRSRSSEAAELRLLTRARACSLKSYSCRTHSRAATALARSRTSLSPWANRGAPAASSWP